MKHRHELTLWLDYLFLVISIYLDELSMRTRHFSVPKKTYPLVNIQTAIENGPIEIVDFPMKNGGSFHSFLYVHQRVIYFPGQTSSTHHENSLRNPAATLIKNTIGKITLENHQYIYTTKKTQR